ncbi:hypothetical protein [Bacillus cereus]|jgi:hypothetical protein|uniref:hypothetical protein n=1 Tax=Bacillus cereus TaxID=1396 RepID=UPI001F350485|nr:hypothetical protein [Bacillus cereus]BCC56617.1 hypothetical protein BCJMU07_p316 [Bacillus cereus]BCD32880.1 hypothetical protein BC30102_p309 [Bacillus cereus]
MHNFDWVCLALRTIDQNVTFASDIYEASRYKIAMTGRYTIVIFDDYDKIAYFDDEKPLKILDKRSLVHIIREETLEDFLEHLYRWKHQEITPLQHQLDFYREVKKRLNLNTYYYFQAYSIGFWIDENEDMQ